MDNAVIVVPAYWGREPRKSGDFIYDHPTSLSEPGTLERFLKSIEILEDKNIELIVISAPTNKDIGYDVHEKVEKMLAPYRTKYKIYHFSYKTLVSFHDILKKNNHEDFLPCISLFGYSNIRNLCISLAVLIGKEVAVLIDDDEVFTDPFFMKKVREGISPERPALAGYYLQPDGDIKLKGKNPWYRFFWNKIDSMNDAFNIITEGKNRYYKTPFVFGGNMIIHKKLIEEIPFDPYVQRGEDISYLVDAKKSGIDFILDGYLSIKHLPPEGKSNEYTKLSEDFKRFIYSRYKMKKEGVPVKELDPYPGYFLKWNLKLRILLTSFLCGLSRILSFRIKEAFRYFMLGFVLFSYRNKVCEKKYNKFLAVKKVWPSFISYLQEKQAEFLKHFKPL